MYRVNDQHPLTEDLTAIVRKVIGVDPLIDRLWWEVAGVRTGLDLRQAGKGCKASTLNGSWSEKS